MAPFKDHTVTIEFTVTREYTFTDSADVVAKTLGISLKALRSIVKGEQDLDEPDSLSALIDAADLVDDDFEVTSVDSEDEG